jgi:hypothetical protein
LFSILAVFLDHLQSLQFLQKECCLSPREKERDGGGGVGNEGKKKWQIKSNCGHWGAFIFVTHPGK